MLLVKLVLMVLMVLMMMINVTELTKDEETRLLAVVDHESEALWAMLTAEGTGCGAGNRKVSMG